MLVGHEGGGSAILALLSARIADSAAGLALGHVVVVGPAVLGVRRGGGVRAALVQSTGQHDGEEVGPLGLQLRQNVEELFLRGLSLSAVLGWRQLTGVIELHHFR